MPERYSGKELLSRPVKRILKKQKVTEENKYKQFEFFAGNLFARNIVGKYKMEAYPKLKRFEKRDHVLLRPNQLWIFLNHKIILYFLPPLALQPNFLPILIIQNAPKGNFLVYFDFIVKQNDGYWIYGDLLTHCSKVYRWNKVACDTIATICNGLIRSAESMSQRFKEENGSLSRWGSVQNLWRKSQNIWNIVETICISNKRVRWKWKSWSRVTVLVLSMEEKSLLEISCRWTCVKGLKNVFSRIHAIFMYIIISKAFKKSTSAANSAVRPGADWNSTLGLFCIQPLPINDMQYVIELKDDFIAYKLLIPYVSPHVEVRHQWITWADCCAPKYCVDRNTLMGSMNKDLELDSRTRYRTPSCNCLMFKG